MKKVRLFYGCLTIYLLVLFCFLSFPFTLLEYEELQGEMLDSKNAIILSKEKLSKKVGYIDNKKVAFEIEKFEKEKDYYISTVTFSKVQKKPIFTIYIKKNQKSILKVLEEEWRMEWKN